MSDLEHIFWMEYDVLVEQIDLFEELEECL